MPRSPAIAPRDRSSAARLLAPAIACVVFLALLGLCDLNRAWIEGLMIDRPFTVATLILEALFWLALTWLVVRLADVVLWHGIVQRRQGHPPARLLTDLAGALMFLFAGIVIAATVFDLPVAGIVTTSSIAVAVIGFALRDMLASLFAGIALNIEQPYGIGDWIETGPATAGSGSVGEVIEVSWLTTRLRTRDGIAIIVPNAQLATTRFRNFGPRGARFRDHVEITLDAAVPHQRIERLLLAAAHSVPATRRVPPGPDLKIEGFVARGIVWRIRYWLDDFADLQETRFAVQLAILDHLHLAGISLPYDKLDLFHERMPSRTLNHQGDLPLLLGRCEIFADLSPAELAELARRAERRRVPAGTTIVAEGEPGNSLFFVLEGALEVRQSRPDGSSQVVNRLTPGSIFGEFSLLTGSPRNATVCALSETLLTEITGDALAPILKANPLLADRLSATLAEREAMSAALLVSRKGAGRAEPTSRPKDLVGRIRDWFEL